jgi:hypothetical protein
MTRWHRFRRRLIRRTLKIPAPLYVLTPGDVMGGLDPERA